MYDILFGFRIERNLSAGFTIWSSLQQRNLLSPFLLGESTKLRKATIYFVMFVRPSVRMK